MQKKLIEKWASFLSEKLGRSTEEIIKHGLSAYDFSPSKSVELYYSKSSIIKFEFAFCVINKETREVAIFTEHYGYHEFSTYGAVIKEIEVTFFVDEEYEGPVI